MKDDDEFDEGTGNGPNKAYRKPKDNNVIMLAKKIFEEDSKETRGVPPKYTPDELEDKIRDYIVYCHDNRLPMTISALVLFVGYADRASFYDLEKKKPFAHTIKKARTVIQAAYEQNLHKPGSGGSVFALKQFGWTDIQITEHRGAMPITITKNYEGKEPKKKEKKE